MADKLIENIRIGLISFAYTSRRNFIGATSAKYVKRGGVIVYSTCTLFSAENEAVFERFLNENDDFEPLPFENGQYINTILPNGKNDGFFFARARRKGE